MKKAVCLLFLVVHPAVAVAVGGSRTGAAWGGADMLLCTRGRVGTAGCGYASVHGVCVGRRGFQILGKYASIRAGMQLPYFVKMYIYTPNSQKRPSIRVFWNVSRMFHADFGCMRKM